MSSLPLDGARLDRSGTDPAAMPPARQGGSVAAAEGSGIPVPAAAVPLPGAGRAATPGVQADTQPDAALRFLQRWHALASEPAHSPTLLESPAQARAQVDRLQWQLAARPAQALQAQGALDPARVAQWLQH